MRDQVPLGQVAVRLMPDESVLAAVGDVAAALSRTAGTDFIARLRAIPAPDGYAPLAAFRDLGLNLSFDSAALELVAVIDPEQRISRTVGLGFANSDNPLQPDDSTPFSLLIAYQASLDWVHNGLLAGLRGPRIDTRINGRIGRAVSFETDLTYDREATRAFSRFGSRLIYDRPESLLRFTLGDQVPLGVGFQDPAEIGGIGAARLLGAFRSDRSFTATTGRRITLREPATVTLVVNGVPSRTLRLGPGTFDLTDLPLAPGANAVELVIENDASNRQVVAFDFFQDIELLAPGVDEFSAQLGVRSEHVDAVRRYDTREPVLSGFYRRGVTPQLTLGANIQASQRVQMVGADAAVGTPLGLLFVEGAWSRNREWGQGTALRAQFRHASPLQQLQGSRRIDVSAEYRSRRFGGIESIIPYNPVDILASVRFGQPVTDRLAFGVSLDFTSFRDGREDRWSAVTNATYRLNPRTTVSAFAGYDNDRGLAFGASILMRIGRSHVASARYDSRTEEASVGWAYSPTRLLDTVAASAQLTRGLYDTGFNGTATWRTNRGDFELAHRAAWVNGGGVGEQVTSLRTRGTIAYAGGRVAIGRYLTDAFAIVDRHPSLGNAQVTIGTRGTGLVEARTGALGPALVSASSYSPRTIYYDVPEGQAAYDLGSSNFTIYPWLHAGHRLTVGTDYHITATGTLLDDRGDPVALVAGRAVRIGVPGAATVEVFTNRVGRLSISGLAPGRWQITAGRYRYDVDVAETPDALVNLGSIRPSAAVENGP